MYGNGVLPEVCASYRSRSFGKPREVELDNTVLWSIGLLKTAQCAIGVMCSVQKDC